MDQKELDERWFNWEPIEGVRYGLNDSVRITTGVHISEGAAVISLLSVDPVMYLIELASGLGDINVLEKDLELIEKSQEFIARQ